MSQQNRDPNNIPGTIIFDGRQAMKGYALNKMCFSFNSAGNREAFLRDEDAYCARFKLTDEQRQAVKHRTEPAGSLVADFVNAEVLGFLALGDQLSE